MKYHKILGHVYFVCMFSYLSSSPNIGGASWSRLGVHSKLHIYPLSLAQTTRYKTSLSLMSIHHRTRWKRYMNYYNILGQVHWKDLIHCTLNCMWTIPVTVFHVQPLFPHPHHFHYIKPLPWEHIRHTLNKQPLPGVYVSLRWLWCYMLPLILLIAIFWQGLI